MQLTFAVPALLAARFVAAIDFTDYDPQPGVQPEFKAFLNALVTPAENPTATTEYTDFFTPDGMQTTLSIHCVGAEAITRCKQRFLPTDGSMTLTHFPNTTFIADNNATATVYEAHGRIENNFKAGNCSQIYYKTQYTVLKTVKSVDAAPNLSTTPEKQVYWYHDYFVNPTGVPSDIPCDSLKA
ncbi:hypothetical protein CH063_11640 [Colletotrichum higginsianum]|uniref:Uncharacterized protein n=2 Tax=Colletotrichum higginsianum TaxID=80884 RepID=H1VM71_COLHI|nr:hypothetical protein CH63R_11276 [Colletotrichum higginsianum IMI 349063]OBR04573.1 hypothetical protein CH63R_11276 [Colletotrichum higginsianum IMI 349063]TIC94030.1 hypothetical protein CH35J_009016 [Colletotrichum higginsianum]CCF41324.1 hypothetical protein CH063_11640 [Colletotrichum higginsianum]